LEHVALTPDRYLKKIAARNMHAEPCPGCGQCVASSLKRYVNYVAQRLSGDLARAPRSTWTVRRICRSAAVSRWRVATANSPAIIMAGNP